MLAQLDLDQQRRRLPVSSHAVENDVDLGRVRRCESPLTERIVGVGPLEPPGDGWKVDPLHRLRGAPRHPTIQTPLPDARVTDARAALTCAHYQEVTTAGVTTCYDGAA